MAELFVVNGICGGTVFFLPDVPTVVGRSMECHVQLPDPWVSNMHAMFERRGGDLWVVDLDSRNGTFVNDRRVREASLPPSARLRFGKTLAELRIKTDIPDPGILNQKGAVVRYLSDLRREVSRALEPQTGDESDVATLSTPLPDCVTAKPLSSSRQVAVLTEIGRALVDAPNLDECLAKILRAVTSAVRAECSSLLLMDPSGKMEVRVSLPQGAAPRLSETVIAAASLNRAGLLTLDAQQDLRFSSSQSIIAQGIHSCLCVPIWAENRILGMLVLDRGVVDPFTAEDLELVTIVGYQAALAIERERFLARATAVEEQRKKLLRHLAPDVANLILSQEQTDTDPLQAAVHDNVTVLFSDVQGFTGLTERLPSDELASLLRDYLRSMTEAIFEERGTLDKFMGDGVLAVFGAPVSLADGAVRAVRCAWNMQQRLARFNEKLPPDRRFAVRTGIQTGRVIAGNFGSAEQLEFTVVGDAVNVASRLQSMAEPGAIYVGRTTYEQAKLEFTFRELGPRVVRGRIEPVEVFQVEAITSGASQP